MTSLYSCKRVLITGGLGFLGSNLALRLVELGAHVTLVDSCVEGCGSNLYNIDSAMTSVETLVASIAETERLAPVLRKADIVFNLAGEISHIHSMLSPERDLRLNNLDQIAFLSACKLFAPGIRVVYAGTRQIYGKPAYLPVDEQHPVNPVDFNGIHKLAAETYHRLLTETGAIDAVTLRLTNVYGPRMALNLPCQGFLGTFFRKGLCGEAIEVFGDGEQLRDPLYVDDAVDAFLRAGAAGVLPSRVYNVGGPEPLPLSAIAGMIASAGGRSGVLCRPFPNHLQNIDIGSYRSDCSRIREELGWCPGVDFAQGVRQTLAYYRQCLEQYLDPVGISPVCSLDLHYGSLESTLVRNRA